MIRRNRKGTSHERELTKGGCECGELAREVEVIDNGAQDGESEAEGLHDPEGVM
jgi:hypothetical protein